MARRSVPRIVLDDESRAHLQPGQPDGAELSIINISVAGAGLIAQTPIGDVGDRVNVTFTLAPTQLSFHASCLVGCVMGRGRPTVAATDRWLCGVYFEGLASHSRCALTRYIECRIRERSEPIH